MANENEKLDVVVQLPAGFSRPMIADFQAWLRRWNGEVLSWGPHLERRDPDPNEERGPYV